MTARFGWIGVLALLIIGGIVAAYGSSDAHVDLSSAAEMWGDILRDVDDVGLHVTRVSDSDEIALGNRLAWQGPRRAGQRSPDTVYVAEVLATLTPYVRRHGLPYSVEVVDLPFENAWAMPGGHIYITRNMLESLQSEAELAAVLGHEIAHVDERHCVERFQYALKLKKIGLGDAGSLVDFARQAVTIGYTKYEEADADAAGMRLMVAAGYDPAAAVQVMSRTALGKPARTPPANPVSEGMRAGIQALGTYAASHPDSDDRVRRLTARMSAERRQLRGRSFYIGVENYRQRIPKTRQSFPGEMRSA